MGALYSRQDSQLGGLIFTSFPKKEEDDSFIHMLALTYSGYLFALSFSAGKHYLLLCFSENKHFLKLLAETKLNEVHFDNSPQNDCHVDS